MIAAEIPSYLTKSYFDFGGIILNNGKYYYDQADNIEYFTKYLSLNRKIPCILVFKLNKHFDSLPPETVLSFEPDCRFWLWYYSDAATAQDGFAIEQERRFARRSDAEWIVSLISFPNAGKL